MGKRRRAWRLRAVGACGCCEATMPKIGSRRRPRRRRVRGGRRLRRCRGCAAATDSRRGNTTHRREPLPTLNDRDLVQTMVRDNPGNGRRHHRQMAASGPLTHVMATSIGTGESIRRSLSTPSHSQSHAISMEAVRKAAILLLEPRKADRGRGPEPASQDISSNR